MEKPALPEGNVIESLATWSPRRWARLALIAAVIAAVLFVIVRARAVLLPFLLGLFVGYLILPAVNGLDRRLARVFPHSVARPLAILIVYLLALGLIAGFFTYLVPVVAGQVQQLITNREVIINEIQGGLAGLRQWLLANAPVVVQDFVQNQLQALGARLSSLVAGALAGALAAVGNTLIAFLGFVIIPFWLIYVLYDAGKFSRGAIGLVPESARPDLLNVGHLFNDVVVAYVRGQLLVAAIVGTLTGLALSLLGVNFAALLGFITAIGGLIPTLGPILAAIPTVLIAALQRPILGLWALLALLAVQQIEGIFIGPRIVGTSVRLSPAVIIVLLVIAGEIFGLLGLLLVVPVAAFLRDVIRYLSLRTARESIPPDGALHQVRKARLGD
ncbi:MAG: AI-2E family transporter [Chloroflexota bacterium]|nr:AI-2E family transporter [Chloroflexota bacterium]